MFMCHFAKLLQHGPGAGSQSYHTQCDLRSGASGSHTGRTQSPSDPCKLGGRGLPYGKEKQGATPSMLLSLDSGKLNKKEKAGKPDMEFVFQRTGFRASFQKLTFDIIALASSIVFFKTCFIFSSGAMKIKQGRGRDTATFKILLQCPNPPPG